MAKQYRKYGVYYIGAPYSDCAEGELDYQSDDLDRCRRYIADHDYWLHGINGCIRDIAGKPFSSSSRCTDHEDEYGDKTTYY